MEGGGGITKEKDLIGLKTEVSLQQEKDATVQFDEARIAIADARSAIEDEGGRLPKAEKKVVPPEIRKMRVHAGSVLGEDIVEGATADEKNEGDFRSRKLR